MYSKGILNVDPSQNSGSVKVFYYLGLPLSIGVYESGLAKLDNFSFGRSNVHFRIPASAIEVIVTTNHWLPAVVRGWKWWRVPGPDNGNCINL